MKKILDEVYREQDAFFIDELPYRCWWAEGSPDASNILKPALLQIKSSGATTFIEYQNISKKTRSFRTSFLPRFKVNEPSADDTVEIFKKAYANVMKTTVWKSLTRRLKQPPNIGSLYYVS